MSFRRLVCVGFLVFLIGLHAVSQDPHTAEMWLKRSKRFKAGKKNKAPKKGALDRSAGSFVNAV